MPSLKKLKLFSPAKINLSLRIVGCRPDGFHDLETLMQTVDLGDTLTFTLGQSDILTCDDSSIPCDSSNFIWQAVQLFRQKTGMQFAVRIDLQKRTPQMRGLGGGSSNVATTLWALNKLLETAISDAQLADWSQVISSDAPFFFSKGTAFCTSKGEKMEERPLPPHEEHYLINPRYGLSTKRVFEEFDRRGLTGGLEEAAFCVEPRLRALKEELQKRFKTVFMTGSGSALICADGKPEGIPIRFIQRGSDWYYLKGAFSGSTTEG